MTTHAFTPGLQVTGIANPARVVAQLDDIEQRVEAW